MPVRTRLGLRIIHTVAPTLMPNTQQWNVPAATQINPTDKFSGSQGPSLGQDKTFSWTLILATLTAWLSPTFGGIAAQIAALQALTKTNPKYVQPSVAETVTGDQPGVYEVGYTISATLHAALTVGDSGGPAPAPNTTISDNVTGELTTNASEALSAEMLDGVDYEAWADMAYLTGVVKNDSLGNPYPTGQIMAGTVEGSHLTWSGSYRWWAGPTGVDYGAIMDIRTQSGLQTGLMTDLGDSQQITLDTGTDDNMFVVALPPGSIIGSVTDLDALGADLTSQFTVVELGNDPLDAAGNDDGYNTYGFTQAVPYGTAHRLVITVVPDEGGGISG